ncbi:MAG TPA: hypothetical protein VMT31_08535 [Methanomicrobiales archaeon]|nr:hypothetical protein [Methanomicrobiales archaeon]
MAFRHLVVLALLLVLAGCLQQAAQPILEFSTGACTQNIEPYIPPEAGILEMIWENETTLRIDGFVKTFCGGAEISGDYAFREDNITLFYTITTPGPVTSCLCAHGVRYRIKGLPKGEYRVVMEKR